MSVIIEISVPAEDFALGRSLDAVESTRFELERMVPTTDAVVPVIWAHDTDPDALETSLKADKTILDARMLDKFDNRALFRVEWASDIDGLVQSIIEHEATILEAIGANGHWEFQLRFLNDSDVSAFQTALTEADIDFTLQRIYNPDDSDRGVSDLTPAQRETLRIALERGYFEIPRETNLLEIADELDISDQAVNERIRRGMVKLVVSSLTAGADAE